jgi:hypothetical protein
MDIEYSGSLLDRWNRWVGQYYNPEQLHKALKELNRERIRDGFPSEIVIKYTPAPPEAPPVPEPMTVVDILVIVEPWVEARITNQGIAQNLNDRNIPTLPTKDKPKGGTWTAFAVGHFLKKHASLIADSRRNRGKYTRMCGASTKSKWWDQNPQHDATGLATLLETAP